MFGTFRQTQLLLQVSLTCPGVYALFMLSFSLIKLVRFYLVPGRNYLSFGKSDGLTIESISHSNSFLQKQMEENKPQRKREKRKERIERTAFDFLKYEEFTK